MFDQMKAQKETITLVNQGTNIRMRKYGAFFLNGEKKVRPLTECL